jgi:hypothetical protein
LATSKEELHNLVVAERPAGKLVQQSSPFEPKQVELAHYKTYGRVVQYQSKIEGCDVSAYVVQFEAGVSEQDCHGCRRRKAGGMGEEIRNWRS